MFAIAWCWCVVLWAAEGAVLDPALYLAPSPPMVPLRDGLSSEALWTQQIRTERDANDGLAVLPIEILKTTTYSPMPARTSPTTKHTPTTAEKEMESMESAETFWPSFRSTGRTGYAAGSVHIPLTFSLTGSYGGYGPGGGVVASRYASVSDGSGLFGGYGKSALAGSSYGAYSGLGATRIYGGNGGAAWSGWGNGKWGHYGKG